MVDQIFPVKAEAKTEPAVDKTALADDMIYLFKNGGPEGYKISGKDMTGKSLPKEDVKALAMAGRDISEIAEQVYNQIVADSIHMKSINPADCKDLTEYKAKLDEKAEYILPDDYYTAMKDYYEVTTFKTLQDATRIEEPVEGLKEI